MSAFVAVLPGLLYRIWACAPVNPNNRHQRGHAIAGASSFDPLLAAHVAVVWQTAQSRRTTTWQRNLTDETVRGLDMADAETPPKPRK